MTQKEAARKLDVDISTLKRAERHALSTIRLHPVLKELWDTLKEEGVPSALVTPRDLGMELVEYQLKLADLWQVHDRLEALGAPEAGEVRREIAQFQSKLRQLMKL